MSYEPKKALMILSAVLLIALFAVHSGAQSPAGQNGQYSKPFPAFPHFPGNGPTHYPSIPAPFPHPFPTASPTPGPSVTPTPVPTAANLYGYVKDTNDNRIPGIYAVLVNQNATYSSTSDSDGYYMICHVPFGNYTLSYVQNGNVVKTANLVLNRSTQKANVTLTG